MRLVFGYLTHQTKNSALLIRHYYYKKKQDRLQCP